jgi:DME family drug/metabolite transporter
MTVNKRMEPTFQVDAPSVTRGRLYVLLAALLWSTSGAFTKVLTKETIFGVHEPPLETYPLGGYQLPLQIACYRTLFAGLVLVPSLRPRDISFQGLMVLMVLFFAAMNATFVSALALGPAANAILLQYSAPLWVYLASIYWLGEKPDRRSTVAMGVGLVGIGIIVGGGWEGGNIGVMIIGLVSGVAYGGVLVCLRLLRTMSAGWLTVWNHLLSGLMLVPLVMTLEPPTSVQMVVLFFFGALQMGLAYWLVAKGLRVVSPQEAGTISLLEPILNPVWAYLVSPETETPSGYTWLGGGVILGALAWRYWPRKSPA